MISIVLYGRNDSYGYNLHKRAAISLNCIAEVLTDSQDEIIFVDYNTPDDFPTFPEAIQDTLTEKAKSILRVLRVRPKLHERYRSQTHLECLEPIARNVGIRRSNPQNRWILSTNTDMVFVPRKEKSLSGIAADLPDAYYHLPRFEVPEALWESADRMNPRGTIDAFRNWGVAFHLNEIVTTSHADIRYDGPGDFQLALRSDLWQIHGFHESMLLGWHVDSNFGRRLALIPRPLGDIVEDLYGYHCDHTRQVTPAHRPRSAQNDQKIFYENVGTAEVSDQAASWGLAGADIEEVGVNATSRIYVDALSSAIREPLDQPTTTGYSGTSYNHLDYPIEHVVPFLADSLASYPRNTVLGWIGAKKRLLEVFAKMWKGMRFSEPIVVFKNAEWLGPELPDHCVWADWRSACERSDVFIFDWGKADDALPISEWVFDKDPLIQEVTLGFRRAVRHERRRFGDGAFAPRRFIGLNAICNAIEGTFNSCIGAALTPLATHIRQGFVTKYHQREELLATLHIGQAGQRTPQGITTLSGVDNYIFYGPYLDLISGGYRLQVECENIRYHPVDPPSMVLEVVSGLRLIACRGITRHDLDEGVFSIEFYITRELSSSDDWPRIEFRLKTSGAVDLTVCNATLEELSLEPPALAALSEFDCAALLSIGPAGKLGPFALDEQRAVIARPGVNDLLVFGPHRWLESGRYEAKFRFDVREVVNGSSIDVYVASHRGIRILGKGNVGPRTRGLTECSVSFQVEEEVPPVEIGLLEFMVWSDGRSDFSLLSVRVQRTSAIPLERNTEDAASGEILHLLNTGPAGRNLPGAIQSVLGRNGVVFFGPYLTAASGNHRAELMLSPGDPKETSADTGLSIAAVSEGRVFARCDISRTDVENDMLSFDFSVPSGSDVRRLELVLRTTGHTAASITSIKLKQTSESLSPRRSADSDCLKSLDVGPAGRWLRTPNSFNNLAIHSSLGTGGAVAYGPYISLEPGEYEVSFEFLIGRGVVDGSIRIEVAHKLGTQVLADAHVTPKMHNAVGRMFGTAWIPAETSLRFAVPEDLPQDENRLFEFRVWTKRRIEFYLVGVRLKNVTEPRQIKETAQPL